MVHRKLAKAADIEDGTHIECRRPPAVTHNDLQSSLREAGCGISDEGWAGVINLDIVLGDERRRPCSKEYWIEVEPLFDQALEYRTRKAREKAESEEASRKYFADLTEDVFRRIESYMRKFRITIKHFFHLVDLDHGGTIDSQELHYGVKQCCNIDLSEDELLGLMNYMCGGGLDDEIEIDQLDTALRYFRKKFAPKDHVGKLAIHAAKGDARMEKFAQLPTDAKVESTLVAATRRKQEVIDAAEVERLKNVKEWDKGFDTAGTAVYRKGCSFEEGGDRVLARLHDYISKYHSNIATIFTEFDKDDSKSLSKLELKLAFGKLGLEMCDEDWDLAISSIDMKGDSLIEYDELLYAHEEWLSTRYTRDTSADLTKGSFNRLNYLEGKAAAAIKGRVAADVKAARLGSMEMTRLHGQSRAVVNDRIEYEMNHALTTHVPGVVDWSVEVPYIEGLHIPGSPDYNKAVVQEGVWNSDAVAVAVAAGTAADDKTCMAVPPYNPQNDPAAASYYAHRPGGFTTADGVKHKFDVVPTILQRNGEDNGGSSILGRAYDKRFGNLPGQQYMADRGVRYKGRSRLNTAGHPGIDGMYSIRTSTRRDVLENVKAEVGINHFVPLVQRRWAPAGGEKELPASIEELHGRRPKAVPTKVYNPPGGKGRSGPTPDDARWRYGGGGGGVKYVPPKMRKPLPPPPPPKTYAQLVRERDTHKVDSNKLLAPENHEFSYVYDVFNSSPFGHVQKKKSKHLLKKQAAEASQKAHLAEQEKAREIAEEEERKRIQMADEVSPLAYLRAWDTSKRPKTTAGRVELYSHMGNNSESAKGWRPKNATLKKHTVTEVAKLNSVEDQLALDGLVYAMSPHLRETLSKELPLLTFEGRNMEAEANMLALFPHLAAFIPTPQEEEEGGQLGAETADELMLQLEENPPMGSPTAGSPAIGPKRGAKAPVRRASTSHGGDRNPPGEGGSTPPSPCPLGLSRRGSRAPSKASSKAPSGSIPASGAGAGRGSGGSRQQSTPKTRRGTATSLHIEEADLYNQRTFVKQDPQFAEIWERRLKKSLSKLTGIKKTWAKGIDVQVESQKAPPRDVVSIWHGWTPLQEIAWAEARLAQTKANLYHVAKPRVSVKEGGLGADIIISERKEDGH